MAEHSDAQTAGALGTSPGTVASTEYQPRPPTEFDYPKLLPNDEVTVPVDTEGPPASVLP
jgi:hypothetical protein